MSDSSFKPARMLEALLHARSVCLVGASADTARTAGQPLQILERHGFGGEVVCVNPKYAEIAGRPCFPSISDLPKPVDVALITLPAAKVPDAIRECGEKGIRNAVVLSAGFEETEGGRTLGDALRTQAARFDMCVLGPNSEGLWSTPAKLLLTHGTAAQRDRILAGPVSILTQSGSIGAATARALQDAGIGCRYLLSLGNETNLSLSECLEWVVYEGNSRVILLFIEGLHDGERFVTAARRAAAAGVALVALKAGQSDAGREATASHTGKMASSERVYSALFRQAGVIEVTSLAELLEAGEVFSIPSGEGGGDQLAVMSASGGCRALIADAAQRRGLRIARFAAATGRRLDELAAGAGIMSNPMDLPMEILYDVQRFSEVARTVAQDPQCSALVVQYANRGVRQVADHLELFGEIRAASGKPLVVSFLNDTPPEGARGALRERGVLCAGEPEQAVRYLGWMAERGRAMRMHRGALPAAPCTRTKRGGFSGGWEAQLALLAQCGIPVPAWRAAAAGQPAAQAIGSLRFPLAVKAFPQDADHKAEAGLVRIGVATNEALDIAIADMGARLLPGASVLVQEMAPPGVEVLLAARIDLDFGPVLAIGTGGAGVEWMGDVTYLSLPCSDEDIERAIDGLRLAGLLGPFRGRPAADRSALVAAARRISDVFLVHPNLRELEINPLFVHAGGQGVTAVDVLTR
jgi:acetate---CoA ligase (ADP-forming)